MFVPTGHVKRTHLNGMQFQGISCLNSLPVGLSHKVGTPVTYMSTKTDFSC